jgi:uncharacterized membrane protein YbhN (UPF0104 family)
MRRLFTAAIAAAITGLCFWLFLTPEVIGALAQLGSQAKSAPLLAAFALTGLVQWLRAWRFAVLSSGRLTLPDVPMFAITLKLSFLNFILPFRLGELGYPALMRQQYGHGLLRSAGVLVIARLFDLATVLAILCGAAAIFYPTPVGRLGLMLGALICATAPVALALLGQTLAPLLLRLVRRASDEVDRTAGSAVWPARGQAAAVVAVLLGFALWLLFGLAAVLVAQAVVDSVSPAAAMLGAAAGNLAFALPVNGIAGLGPAQAAWVLATTWTGVPRQDAVVSALALHAMVLSNALLLGGLAFAGGRGRSLRQYPLP